MPFQTSLLPFVLILVSCLPAREQEGEREKLVRTEASALLDALRAGRWDEAVPFVSLDEVTRSRMEIPAGASEDEVRARVCAWFEGLYGRMKPGPVASVRIDPEDPDLVAGEGAEDQADFQAELAELLRPGEIEVAMEIGREKMRYLAAGGWAVDSEGKTIHLDFGIELYERIKQRWPGVAVTDASY